MDDDEFNNMTEAEFDEVLAKIGKRYNIDIYKSDSKMNDVEKVALDEAVNAVINKRRKGARKLYEFDIWNGHPPGTIVAPTCCVVFEVLVKDNEKVEKGQPMFVLDHQVHSSFEHYTEQHKSKIKKIMEENSRVGIYAMEDVLVNEENSPIAGLDNEDALERFQNFKNFDILVDNKDHLFLAKDVPMNQATKDWAEGWANTIKDEWVILKERLPETMFVRVCESRMDLLRAAFIGPEGTPYHHGLFFFDVFFPPTYPYSPPVVRYHSCGLSIHPNVYKCGEIKFNRLVRTNDNKAVKWVAGTSNILQLLLTIRDRILSPKPYLRPLESARDRNSVNVEMSSLLYNENTFINSLKTMVFIMNKPPMYFEDLVVGHFLKHADDILMACKGYIDGLPFRCLFNGVQEWSYSIEFRNDVASCIKPLVEAFSRIGAKGVDDFLPLSEITTPLPVGVPVAYESAFAPTSDAPHHLMTLVAPAAIPPGGTVLVEVGMEVRAGHRLFVYEAMNMEV